MLSWGNSAILSVIFSMINFSKGLFNSLLLELRYLLIGYPASIRLDESQKASCLRNGVPAALQVLDCLRGYHCVNIISKIRR